MPACTGIINRRVFKPYVKSRSKGYRGGKEEAWAGVYVNTLRKPTTLPTKVAE
jgi:hypothetical protein